MPELIKKGFIYLFIHVFFLALGYLVTTEKRHVLTVKLSCYTITAHSRFLIEFYSSGHNCLRPEADDTLYCCFHVLLRLLCFIFFITRRHPFATFETIV